MNLISKRFRVAAAIITAISLGACSYVTDPPLTSPYVATVGKLTPQNVALRNVPAPKERVTVSVYGFPDLTGQYKESENFQTLSRAVSQGGASVLIKALQDAGQRSWFSVLDRSSLNDVVQERQIITEMRRLYRNETQINPGAVAPLKHASILIQGGITGYDSNTVTGGLGARYLGIGANKRWKLDVATVSLRAVSAQTGETLASVVVRKPIASVSNQGNVFTYVALDELLEIETGVAINEPRTIAIEQSIEKGVMALIAEGADIGLWAFKDHSAGQRFVASYKQQLYSAARPVETEVSPPTNVARAIRNVATRPFTRRTARRQSVSQIKQPVPAPQTSQLPTPPAPTEGEVVG